MSGAGVTGFEVFVGTPIYATRNIERGTFYVGQDLSRRSPNGQCIFEGIGLMRGVAYRAPGLERGYVIGQVGIRQWQMLDAVTGQLVTVSDEDAVEVEERYRWVPLHERLAEPA